MTITTKQILKAIGCPYLQLQKGDGYWYFVYDRPEANMFETESVYCMRLNDAPSVEWWAADGRTFVARVEAEAAERAPALAPGQPLRMGWRR